jgi:predicted nuclease of predicted toxin-antitoxin system
MRFLCDVHITYKLVNHLKNLGFEAIHVNQILDKSETKDSDICRFADDKGYIVITKDADFRDTHFIKKTPKQLIKINLGNISNQELIATLSNHIHLIEQVSNKTHFLLEVNKDDIQWIEV